ncbi:MAG: YraN family protein [Patescibacteria group bacterium]|jgi:putative endonuclease
MLRSKAVGEYGEEVARKYLASKGFRLVASNLKLSYREIDIIALEGDVLVFAEVKTRVLPGFGSAVDALGGLKIKRLKIAIGHYLSSFKGIKYSRVRLDFIAIDINKEKKIAKIRHFFDIA